MKTWSRTGLGILVVVGLIGATGLGCKDKSTNVIVEPLQAPYKPAISPENVTFDLQTCYQHRDIEVYGILLAPEFRFYFQDTDVPVDLGRPYWVHDEDTTGTGLLFRTPQVNGINVALTYGEATAATEVGMPPGAMKIHVQAHLEVDDVNGTTYVVDGDFEDLYFRKGLLQNAGEDTTRWYLFEWHDIKNPGLYGVPSGGIAAVESAATSRRTWGRLKQMYN
jgi:hypothetical protein